jgi:cobalamin-dependent methionine synthase I
VEVGETLNIQVFGECEQFKILRVETAAKSEADVNLKKVITKDTVIEIVKDQQEGEEEGKNGIEEIEQIMKDLSLKEGASQVQFGGFR